MVGVWYRRKLRGTREASNGGRVRVRIIHGLNVSQKNSYTYCKNLQVIKNKVFTTRKTATNGAPNLAINGASPVRHY